MNNLRNLRIKKGYSIQKLSDMTGIPFRSLQDWDAEKRQIQAYHRVKLLARVLECSPDDLMTKEEKCLYGAEKAKIALTQEETGVSVMVIDNESCCVVFETIMPREKALELLEYIKKDKDVKPFLQK